MNRRSILRIIGISYLVFWLLWIIVFLRYIPQVAHYGFFFPFVFFFPFFGWGRRGKRTRDSVQNRAHQQERGDEYSSDSMLAEEYLSRPILNRNLIFYLIGILILAGGLFVIYLRLY